MKLPKISPLLLIVFTSYLSFSQIAVETPEPSYIKTIQFRGDTFLGELPTIKLGDPLQLSFDDIIGDEHDYYYKITHHDADWSPSKLARSEFMRGMDNVRILDIENSVATLQMYSNYHLNIPNKFTQALTKTGNYLISIHNEEGELVFSRKFMIYNPQFAVGVQIKRSRDLNYVNTKQVVRFFVDGGEQLIINPRQNLKVVIIQNNNLKTAITGIAPQFTVGNKLEYRYDQETAFWAGNEFFNFENKDIRGATAAIRYIELKSLYHNYLYTNPTRKDIPYTFNPDINGNFVITTLQGRTPRSEAEYAWIHFSLNHTELDKGKELHVYGNFNNYVTNASTKLTYNPRTYRYELPMLLKQGFYNYKYVLVEEDGTINRKEAISGNYWQTENDYQILAYYRRPGGRFDELVGVGSSNSSVITN
ncbi:DUF5103 domain-containing protein [uncultured Dokdonia sp.]|uniref:type IX secretion system plug protein n=1 Tax=uncultured Dokdonia sp. TaxID=575653 RepID=UPI00260E464B|nr:DUF5103 domain-containing protein [uncultured Dokdonia sp.]